MKFWLPSTKAYFFQSNVRCLWTHSASRIKLLLILLGLSLSVVTRNTCYLSILVRMYSRPQVQFFPNTDSCRLANNIKFVGACFFRDIKLISFSSVIKKTLICKKLKQTLLFWKMYNKIKRELHATDCECFKSNLTRPISCRVCCQMFKKWHLCKNLLLHWQWLSWTSFIQNGLRQEEWTYWSKNKNRIGCQFEGIFTLRHETKMEKSQKTTAVEANCWDLGMV